MPFISSIRTGNSETLQLYFEFLNIPPVEPLLRWKFCCLLHRPSLILDHVLSLHRLSSFNLHSFPAPIMSWARPVSRVVLPLSVPILGPRYDFPIDI